MFFVRLIPTSQLNKIQQYWRGISPVGKTSTTQEGTILLRKKVVLFSSITFSFLKKVLGRVFVAFLENSSFFKPWSTRGR